ncbi:MAG TPA: DUF262 domain-containing protein [Aquella sp.]|nr:DUF262 domain-containing protein [Aquella sp.]
MKKHVSSEVIGNLNKDDLSTIITKQTLLYDYRLRDYPFDVIEAKFVDPLKKDEKRTVIYVPEYQREFTWDNKRKARFIESAILKMPFAPFLVAEDDYGMMEIIDGSQRIRTLLSFRKNEFKLTELRRLPLLNGKQFNDLPETIQNQFLNLEYRFFVVSKLADDDIKQDIFDRINTSAKLLNPSELRKGAFKGKFLELIQKLSQAPNFRKICPLPEFKIDAMEYEELILRFFAYSENLNDYKGFPTKFINQYLEKMNHSEFDEQEHINKFNKVINFVTDYFPYGFAKTENSTSTFRARFEAISVGTWLAISTNKELNSDRSFIKEWLESTNFEQIVTSDAANNKSKLEKRINFVKDKLLSLL